MTHADIFVDILLVTGAAFVGGYIAQLLRLPTIIGFLAAGMALGPYTPGPSGNIEEIEIVAELGVIFLMFALGIQESFRELFEYRKVALLGGAVQVVLTAAVSFAVSPLLGLSWEAGLVLGFLIAISSTVVALKTLETRGALGSVHGRAVIALCIFQDLAVIFMILMIPSLGGGGLDVAGFGFALAKGALLIAIAYVLATVVVPRLWRNLAFRRSRELSLLASLTLAVGLAAGSGLMGLSVAFGAFLAGVAVSESEYGFQTLADILPLREIFAVVFFVAIGMLIDPAVLLEEPVLVLGTLLLAIVAKGSITAAVVRAVGMPGAEALRAGAVMAQVGEFSFVLAQAGLAEGLLTDDVGSAFLMGSALTIVLSPLVLASTEPILTLFRRVPLFAPFLGEHIVVHGVDDFSVNRHVIIGGFGRTGQALVRSMTARRLPFVVVDSNPYALDRAKEAGVPFILGDISRPEVLAICNVAGARILALTFDDDPTERVAVINSRLVNPRLDVIIRGSGYETHRMLRQLGASEVVEAEFEASLEFIRHVLFRFGVETREILAIQAARRAEYYRS